MKPSSPDTGCRGQKLGKPFDSRVEAAMTEQKKLVQGEKLRGAEKLAYSD